MHLWLQSNSFEVSSKSFENKIESQSKTAVRYIQDEIKTMSRTLAVNARGQKQLQFDIPN